MMIRMSVYYWTDKQTGEIVAVNWIAGHKGQTHRHPPEEWETWKAEAEANGLVLEEVSL